MRDELFKLTMLHSSSLVNKLRRCCPSFILFFVFATFVMRFIPSSRRFLAVLPCDGETSS
jgi:hypothetical protein